MKKVLIILVIALFVLASCSSTGSNDSTREKLKESQKKILGSFTDSMNDKEKEKFDDYIDCYVDNIYKKLDDKTIEKLADVDNISKSQDFDKELSEKEKDVILVAASKCTSKLYTEN